MFLHLASLLRVGSSGYHFFLNNSSDVVGLSSSPLIVPMFAVPVHPIGAYSQVNMQTDAYNHLFIWLSQIEAELQALWTWFQNMENRPIVQVGMQTLQDLEARVDRLEALTRSTEVLQQILQRLDLILDLVQNLDSNALGWPPLRCQPNSGPTSGSANRLHEEANNPEKMDQLFSSPNGTDSNKSTVTVTGRQERGLDSHRDDLLLLIADLRADVATMEEFEDHELLANGSESLLASSQARLDPTKPPFEPSTAKKPTKEHGPDQSYRPSDPLARLEALGHSLDQSMHAPKSLVSNSSASHAARMSNDALEDEPRSSFLERLQQRGIKFSQPQQISPPRDIGGDEDNAPRNSEQSPQSPKPEERGTKFSRPQQIVLSRDTGCDEDNALRNSGQNLQSPTPYERELSSDASRGKDHDKSLSIRNIKLAKQVLAGSLMEENNPPGASKVQEPLKAEAAHLSNKIHPASHQSTSESPSTVLKMISSDFYMRYQNSNAMKSPRKHELSSTQVGSRSHPASAIIEDTSVPDVKDPLILEKPGDKGMPLD